MKTITACVTETLTRHHYVSIEVEDHVLQDPDELKRVAWRAVREDIKNAGAWDNEQVQESMTSVVDGEDNALL
ncbi:hypothetical protein [Parendozoicomonas haliclonae]|uniref:Uncharacterized protein n=1 Tax=Parendozoicomonas haliclonae TaxID=1960125 RepID=A0A1X7AEP8_9GAMM|nr:hypothetical protein [Parendozoicomonas haliclonae]SMA33450.1 hypothetical protein EHSB41UT_00284 [Parendozoicomonas haliclonae]